MHKKMTKLCSLALAAVMTLSFVPVYHNTVKAENEDVQMEGTSKEVLDELRISSTQVSLGDEGENPYSENSDTVINMFPRMELMMRDNVNDDTNRGRTIVYNYDKTESGNIWDNEESSYTTEDSVYSTNSVGVDIDFNGKKDHAARISVTKDNGRSVFKLYIEDYTGKRLKTVDLGEFDTSIYNEGFNQLAQLQITAGDYDGDGGDEVAVGVKGEVIVYDVFINDGGDIELNEIRRINNSELVNVPTESTNTYNQWPQTQLTSGDLTGDNRDELIITAGYRKGLGTAKITPRTNIYSQKKGETELTRSSNMHGITHSMIQKTTVARLSAAHTDHPQSEILTATVMKSSFLQAMISIRIPITMIRRFISRKHCWVLLNMKTASLLQAPAAWDSQSQRILLLPMACGIQTHSSL